MGSPTIRRATADDAPELARLRWQFRSEYGPVTVHRDDFRRRFEAFVAEALAGGRWAMFAAEAEGRLVGTAFVQVVPKVPAPTDEGTTIAYLTNVFVEPGLRDTGLGTRLMEAALEWARGRDPDSVIVWPSERSVPFYRRAGFLPATEMMELRPSR